MSPALGSRFDHHRIGEPPQSLNLDGDRAAWLNRTYPLGCPAESHVADQRTFTAKYRAGVLAEYEAAVHGEKSAVLRREGIYHIEVAEWARARDVAGLSYRRGLNPRSSKSVAADRSVNASVHYSTYGAIDDARQQTLTRAWQ